MIAPLDVGTPATDRPIGRELAVYGDRTALITPDGEISYRSLAGRVGAVAHRLGGGRRLVLLAGSTTVDTVVAYLGAMTGGHPVLLAPDEDAVIESLTSAYDPDVVIRPGRSCHERRPGSVHGLHPELALMMSTSGSTGSPKLVRLSYRNVRSNAEAIATYLGLRDTDRAATTLPLHYCYGLSVLNSHLVRGAGIVLTGLSVADPCFWELFRAAGGTGLAGVPYTFTLLDRVGFDQMDLPHLRYVTQAGGRMAPQRVRRLAETGRRRGWDLFVMYGQTEATARIAYLPPGRAATNPAAVGVPVPGGALRLDPVEDAEPGVGELVYTGPNVMLVNRVAAVLAGSSLFIYLTHWQIYPPLADRSRPLALLASLAAGVLLAAAISRCRCRRPKPAPILDLWRRAHTTMRLLRGAPTPRSPQGLATLLCAALLTAGRRLDRRVPRGRSTAPAGRPGGQDAASSGVRSSASSRCTS